MNKSSLRVHVCKDEAVRLDVYLAQVMSASRTKMKQAISDSLVHVNGRIALKASKRLQRGDRVSLRVVESRPMALSPEPLPLDIVYEDDSIIVVNKAAGMSVHPGAGRPSGTLVNALLHHVGADTLAPTSTVVGLSSGGIQPSGIIRPGIVHRLDMDTSGLMVIAKDDFTHRTLQEQFEARTIDREYVAIVWGVPDPASGIIEAPIGRSMRHRTQMAVRANGRRALTHYKTIKEFSYAAVVLFRLETGRTHQIRVHARHIGHPIMGDRVYSGNEIRSGFVTGRRRAFYAHVFRVLTRQALHARTLGFNHPRSEAYMSWHSDLPSDMSWVLTQLDKDPIGNR